MYSITICKPLGNTDEQKELIIWSDATADAEEMKIQRAELNLEVNTAGTLSLTIPYNNVGYNKIDQVSTVVKVYRENSLKQMEEIWRGRVISEEKDIWNSRVLTCEGELALLNDTDQLSTVYTATGTVEEYLTNLLEIHNDNYNSDEYKFYTGIVTVQNYDDKHYWYTDYESTWECISKYLLNEYGGVLRIRWQDGKRYLDYLRDYPPQMSNTVYQEIVFGSNMMDITRYWDLSDFATVILPLGSHKERPSIDNKVLYDPGTEEEIGPRGGFVYIDPIPKYKATASEIKEIFSQNPTLVIGDKNYRKLLEFSINPQYEGIIKTRYVKNTAVVEGVSVPQMIDLKTVEDWYPDLGEYLTIESVNTGDLYLENTEAVQQYGRIVKIVHFDDIEEPAKLLAHGKQYLTDIQFNGAKIELSAVDLHYFNLDFKSINFLDQIRVRSIPHQIDKILPVTHMTIQLNDPSSGQISLSTDVYKPVPNFSEIVGETLIGEGVSRPVMTLVNGVKRGAYEEIKENFGFHIEDSVSDPYEKVTYLGDAEGMTPAHMNFETGEFEWGSWKDAFFMPKPCILGHDGTVITYLDPDDYTKDTNGNPVTIDSGLIDAEVMMEWPKIWRKIVPDEDNPCSASIYIANVQIDEDYKDWAYIDQNGTHKMHFYTSVYYGTLHGDKIRSISGQTLESIRSGHTALDLGTQFTYAQNVGPGWYSMTWADLELIYFLLILISKSTSNALTFGGGTKIQGDRYTNYVVSGLANQRGLFYGTNSIGSATPSNPQYASKLFGMEYLYASGYRHIILGWLWRVEQGETTANTKFKVKMCFGTEDGSTMDDYIISDMDHDGYVEIGGYPTVASGYGRAVVTKMRFGTTMFAEAVTYTDSHRDYDTPYHLGLAYNGGFRYGRAGIGIDPVHNTPAVSPICTVNDGSSDSDISTRRIESGPRIQTRLTYR